LILQNNLMLFGVFIVT